MPRQIWTILHHLAVQRAIFGHLDHLAPPGKGEYAGVSWTILNRPGPARTTLLLALVDLRLRRLDAKAISRRKWPRFPVRRRQALQFMELSEQPFGSTSATRAFRTPETLQAASLVFKNSTRCGEVNNWLQFSRELILGHLGPSCTNLDHLDRL